jgi:ubiquinone biosynthesis protein
MLPDATLIDPHALAAVIPDCYAEFRPLVADGLTFFLRHLSPVRLAGILRAQAGLPAGAALERRLVLFLHACPALHKLGQVVARHRHLDAELRRHLQELESLEPQTPAEELRPVLSRELAGAAAYRVRVAERHLAEGSVAVVVPLTWSDPADGARAPRRRGVAKVLRPGVVERLAADLDILAGLAAHLEERAAAWGLPPLAYRDALAEVAELLTNEVDLRKEQDHLRRARAQLAGRPDVQVPGLLPFCTGALTAMDYVDGGKITDPRPPWRRSGLFRSVVGALLSDVLFSRDEAVLFHGDPHAGNLLATRDGRLAILDWSLAGRLTADDRARLAQILLGGWTLDPARVARAVAGLACGGIGEGLLRRQVAATLADVGCGRSSAPSWVVGLLDRLARAGIRFPPRLLLFRKAFFTLQGVLADVFPAGSPDSVLMTDLLVRLAWEWPLRWWKPLVDRDYATHVSSGDLLGLVLGAPATLTRAWQRLVPCLGAGAEGPPPTVPPDPCAPP